MTSIPLSLAELKAGLTGLAKLNSKSINHPILNHIKIERTKDGWITLTRTDLERFITVRLEQPSQGPPTAFLASYEHLAGIVKTCTPKDTITLTQNPDKSVSGAFNSHGEQMNVKIPSLPVEDFPIIPRMKGYPVPVPPALRHSLQEAFECVSEDPDRRSLNGAFLDVSQPLNQHLVATDGRHMYTSNSLNLPIKQSLIIPRHKFLLWRDFNMDGEWQMRVTDVSDAKTKVLVQLSTRRWRFITKTISGTYPNWRNILVDPSSIKTLITIDPQKVESLIARIEKLPCHDVVNLTTGIELDHGKLSILGKALGAKTWEKMPVDCAKISGPDITILINRHLFIKALRFGLTDIGFGDALSPMRFSHDSREMVVMPLRPGVESDAIPPPASTNNRRRIQTGSPVPSPRRQPQLAHASVPADVFTGIKVLRESFRSGLSVLKGLASMLKETKREQKRQMKNPAAVT